MSDSESSVCWLVNESVKVDDPVTIDTSHLSGEDWMFGIVSRKTKRTIDIIIHKTHHHDGCANGSGYSNVIEPLWGKCLYTVKAWADKEGNFWWKDKDIDSRHLVYNFDPDRQYRDIGYY